MNKLTWKTALQHFLIEDIQHKDITSEAIFPKEKRGAATFYAKENGILAGLSIIQETYRLLDDKVSVQFNREDGEAVRAGDAIAEVEGPIRAILSGERVILNLIQRMSGIATLTNKAKQTLNNPDITLIDTRKTTPGLRMFEKYAVTCGGGRNHRFGLYDMVMIKDNHIAFAGSITKAVTRVREQLGPATKIEVETETIEQVKEAVRAKVDLIMFDNRTAEEINKMASFVPDHIVTEASGGITLDTLANYRHANVDFISLGFLTHSVRALDISLMFKGEK